MVKIEGVRYSEEMGQALDRALELLPIVIGPATVENRTNESAAVREFERLVGCESIAGQPAQRGIVPIVRLVEEIALLREEIAVLVAEIPA